MHIHPAIPILTVTMTVGCVSSRPRSVGNVPWPNAASRYHFAEAHASWVRFQKGEFDGEHPEEGLDEALEGVRTAQREQGFVALYRNQEGELLLALATLAANSGDLDLARSRLLEARSAFEDCVRQVPIWVPGYLGLAKVAMALEDREVDRTSLNAASRALKRVAGLEKKEPSLFDRVLGLSFRDSDAAPPPEEGLQILRAWMAESERWQLDLRELPDPELPLLMSVDAAQGDLLERYRLRLAFQLARVDRYEAEAAGAGRETATREFVDHLTSKVLAAGELADAYLARGYANLELRNFQAARGDLLYLSGGDLPLLDKHPGLLATLDEIDLHLAEGAQGTGSEGRRKARRILAEGPLQRLAGPASAGAIELYAALLLDVPLGELGQAELTQGDEAIRHARTVAPLRTNEELEILSLLVGARRVIATPYDQLVSGDIEGAEAVLRGTMQGAADRVTSQNQVRAVRLYSELALSLDLDDPWRSQLLTRAREVLDAGLNQVPSESSLGGVLVALREKIAAALSAEAHE